MRPEPKNRSAAQPARWSRWPLLAIAWLAAMGWLPSACGQVDPGAADLARIRRLPDPRAYGLQIHPLLAGSCAAVNCHGQPGTFQLQAAEQAMAPDIPIAHPLDLEEPFRSGYYTVLGACDLQTPEASRLLRWAGGGEPSHPGGKALDLAGQTALLAWLRSGGSNP